MKTRSFTKKGPGRMPFDKGHARAETLAERRERKMKRPRLAGEM